MTLPEILSAAVVGPEEVLVLRGEFNEATLEAAMQAIRAAGLSGRVLVVDESIELLVVPK